MKNFRLLMVGTFACVVAMSLFALDAQAQGRRPGPPQHPGREMAPPPAPHREMAPPPPRREYQMVWERLPDGRWIHRRVEVRPEPRPMPHHPAPAPRPEYRPAPPPHHHPEPYYPEPSVGRAVGTLIDAAIRGDL